MKMPGPHYYTGPECARVVEIVGHRATIEYPDGNTDFYTRKDQYDDARAEVARLQGELQVAKTLLGSKRDAVSQLEALNAEVSRKHCETIQETSKLRAEVARLKSDLAAKTAALDTVRKDRNRLIDEDRSREGTVARQAERIRELESETARLKEDVRIRAYREYVAADTPSVAVGEGWRELGLDDIIREGDEFLETDGRWVETGFAGRSVRSMQYNATVILYRRRVQPPAMDEVLIKGYAVPLGPNGCRHEHRNTIMWREVEGVRSHESWTCAHCGLQFKPPSPEDTSSWLRRWAY